MHKKILLICLIFLLVGCKKMESNENYIEFVNNCLNDKHMTNEVSLGYQYYVPKGVRKVRDYDYNQVFLVDDFTMYLYVDIISYFYQEKQTSNREINGDYYYQPIEYQGKTGYLRIVQQDEDYFVTIEYHYSKIEVYTSKESLSKVITMASIILNSIDYNDTVIEKVLEGDLGQFSEFTYEVDKPDDASSNFSQFLEEYVQKEEEKEQLPGE